jgi:hypothetical protein
MYVWPGGNGRWETEMGDIVKFWLATVLMLFGYALFIYALALGVSAHAHDWRKPDLDGWYDSLHRHGFGACCSKDDCHETGAEIRGNDWWRASAGPRVRPRAGSTGSGWIGSGSRPRSSCPRNLTQRARPSSAIAARLAAWCRRRSRCGAMES